MTSEPAPRLDDTTGRHHRRRLSASLRERVDSGQVMTAVAGVLVVATIAVGVVQAASPRRGGQSLLLPASGPTTTGDVTMTFTPELGGRPDASIGTYPTPDASAAPQPATATTADSSRPAPPPAPSAPLPATPPAPARRQAAPAAMSVVAYEAEDPANSRESGTWLRAVRGTSGGYVPVNLASGGNTIEIGNEQGYAPDIDRIVVR